MNEARSLAPNTDCTLPGAPALQLLDLLSHWRIDPDEFLRPSGLTARVLEEPKTRIPLSTMNQLLARAREVTGEPAIGVFLGLRRRISNYGFLGFAAMHASTLGEAMQLGVQYGAVVSSAVRLRLDVVENVATLRIEESADLGSVHDIVLMMFMIGLEQMGRALTGHDIENRFDFSIARPSYCDRFPDLFSRAHFDQPVTQLIFDAQQLELPLRKPDRAGLRLAQQQCERALCDLGLDATLVETVRDLISTPTRVRSLSEVAAALHLTPRTFKRRLRAQGASFSELVEEERRHRARTLLRSSRLSLDQISERLGYSSVPCFVRAFRRWTGRTPAAYRRAAAEGSLAPPPRA